MRLAIPQAATLLAWGAAILAGVWSVQPPAVVSAATAGAEGFSAERALPHIQALAAVPRPVGSAAHAAARAYLVDTLRALGWQVEVQTSTATVYRWGAQWVVPIHNIEARLPGQGPAVLVAAHYDSVPTGPGAGDDAASVAAMLETARALAVRPPPGEVRFLLTDAEEVGLLGASVFLDAGRAEALGAVLNYEARGVSGPSILFEVGGDSRVLLDAFARSPHPLGNSLADAVYRMLPNDTDFSVLRLAGAPGLNFAFMGGLPHYHAATDRAEQLDLRSVQHHGEGMLALVRALASAPPSGSVADAPAQVFFTLPGGWLARYPASWALPLGVLGVLGLLVALVRGRLSGAAVLRGSGRAALAALAASLVGLGGGLALWQLLPESAGLVVPTIYDDRPWQVLLVLLSAGAALAVVGRSPARPAVLAGGALLWMLGALALAALVPGASYLFFWPAVGLIAALILPAPWDRLGLLPALLLVTPVAALLFPTLGWPAAPVVGLLVGLVAATAAPLVLRDTPRSARPGLVVVLVALLLAPLGVRWAPFSPGTPRQDGLVFWQDQEAVTARWSRTPGAGDWTNPLFTDAAPAAAPDGRLLWGEVETVAAAAAVPGLLEVTATDRQLDSDGDVDVAEVRLQSPLPGAILLELTLPPERIVSLTLDGHPVPSPSRGGDVLYLGPLWEGVVLRARVVGPDPAMLQVRATAFGLPPGVTRPEATGPTPWGLGVTDLTVVEQRLAL